MRSKFECPNCLLVFEVGMSDRLGSPAGFFVCVSCGTPHVVDLRRWGGLRLLARSGPCLPSDEEGHEGNRRLGYREDVFITTTTSSLPLSPDLLDAFDSELWSVVDPLKGGEKPEIPCNACGETALRPEWPRGAPCPNCGEQLRSEGRD